MLISKGNEMRKLNKFIIWPVYFDQGKTRKDGRRVPKNQAVISPKIAELKEAADKLGLKNEINLETHFPKTHWIKSGMLLVEKRDSKEETIREIAEKLMKIKSQQLTVNRK